MTRRTVAMAALVVVCATGCGVNSEDAPVPIEDTTDEAPQAPPSIDTEPRPTPSSSPTSSPTSSPAPTRE